MKRCTFEPQGLILSEEEKPKAKEIMCAKVNSNLKRINILNAQIAILEHENTIITNEIINLKL